MSRLRHAGSSYAANMQWGWPVCNPSFAGACTVTCLRRISSKALGGSAQLMNASKQKQGGMYSSVRTTQDGVARAIRMKLTTQSNGTSFKHNAMRDNRMRGSESVRAVYVDRVSERNDALLEIESDNIMDRLSKIKEFVQVDTSPSTRVTKPSNKFDATATDKEIYMGSRRGAGNASLTEKLEDRGALSDNGSEPKVVLDIMGRIKSSRQSDMVSHSTNSDRSRQINQTPRTTETYQTGVARDATCIRTKEQRSTTDHRQAMDPTLSKRKTSTYVSKGIMGSQVSRPKSRKETSPDITKQSNDTRKVSLERAPARQPEYIKPVDSQSGSEVWCLHSQTIQSCAQRGDFRRALEVLAAMNTKGMSTDTHTYNNVVRSYRGFDGAIANSELTDIKSLEGVLKQMRSLNIPLDARASESVLHLYRRLAAHYDKKGLWQGALQVFGDAQKYRLPLDISAYASVVSACVKGGRYDYGLTVLRAMHTSGVTPTQQTYGVLLGGYARTGKWEGSVSVLREMQAKGVPPDVYTYSSVLKACAVGDAPMVAAKVLEDMHKAGIEPNAVLFTSAMRATGAKGQRGWTEALEMFRAMQAKGVAVDTLAYNTLIKVCMSVNKKWTWRVGVDLLDEMRAMGSPPNTATYNALIPGVFQYGGEAEADNLLQAMREDGVCADVIMYNTRIAAYSTGGRWVKAESLVEEMLARDIRPDTVTYNTVIKACARGRAGVEAVRFLRIMQESGLTPDLITYKGVIASCARAGEFKEAYRYLHILQTRKGRLSPDVGVYSALIADCAKEENHLTALGLLRDMQKDNVPVTTRILYNVIHSCAHAGELGLALSLLRHIQSVLSVPVTTAAYNTLISACIRHQNYGLTNELALEMSDSGVRLDAESFRIFSHEKMDKGLQGRILTLKPSNMEDAQTYDNLIKKSDNQEVFRLLAEMQLKGLPPTPIALEKCVYFSIRLEKHHLGLNVLYDMEVLGLPPVARHYYEIVTSERWTSEAPEPRLALLSKNPRNFLSLNRHIYLCAREGEWQLAVKHLHTMRSKAGMSPDVSAYRGVVSACVRGGQVDLAKTIIKEALEAEARPDYLGLVKIYESAIHAFCGSDRSMLALDMCRDFQRVGLVPHVAVFNATLNVLACDNEVDMCVDLLREMQCNNIAPTAASYRHAAKACVADGKWETAKRLAHRASVGGLEDRGYMYQQVLKACARARESQEGLAILRDLPEEGIKPDVTMYAAVIAACGQNYELELAHELLQEMPQTHNRLRDYHMVFEMCGQYGGHMFALSLLRTMQSGGEMQPDDFCYTNVMKALALDKVSHECVGLLREMRSVGIEPSRAAYGSAISACERGRKWEAAVDLLREMQAKNLAPGKSEYGPALAACAHAGELTTALGLWAEMETAAAETGLNWHLDYYSQLIMAHARAGRKEEGLTLLRVAEKRMPVLRIECYNAAMYGYAVEGDWAKSLELLRECASRQLKPNAATYNTVVKACEVGNQPELLVDMLVESHLSGLSKTDSWYGVAIVALSGIAQTAKLADVLYDNMIQDVDKIQRCWLSWAVTGTVDLHNHSQAMARAAVRRALRLCQTRWRATAAHERERVSAWFSKLNVGRGKRSIKDADRGNLSISNLGGDERLIGNAGADPEHKGVVVVGPAVIQFLRELEPPIRAAKYGGCWIVVDGADLRAWLVANENEYEREDATSAEGLTLTEELWKARRLIAGDQAAIVDQVDS
ncbi:hypothetical protein SARC_05320 [Sphaeroforma arctica JP610]|uniref:PROP1-like PPR domain-containing protein n=1 Tax=Sphaeroforma arctica JP610 TaxID=667725 RepID=A0A0L0G2H0_9EUKA|nr:hypothetical protein SARC_05320 [Sphaeroforma arctica JP610]KNC82393.1 hypothetical protein SARC_05320 [Sphaeroforma arctica JP610]|eukprot:XP_014156295.1 hypothetical protein SARC_05320 [Sphaeroforma arctica JP610]